MQISSVQTEKGKTMKDIISITMGELTTAFDNEVMRAVQKVGIDVDKEELLKALELHRSLVRCGECRKVREDGGHANCNGYLYCRKWKTLVDEDCYCSWGEREGE